MDNKKVLKTLIAKKWSERHKKLSCKVPRTVKLTQFKVYNLNIISNIYIMKKTNRLATAVIGDILRWEVEYITVAEAHNDIITNNNMIINKKWTTVN